jgi:hypothetical protein
VKLIDIHRPKEEGFNNNSLTTIIHCGGSAKMLETITNHTGKQAFHLNITI